MEASLWRVCKYEKFIKKLAAYLSPTVSSLCIGGDCVFYAFIAQCGDGLISITPRICRVHPLCLRCCFPFACCMGNCVVLKESLSKANFSWDSRKECFNRKAMLTVQLCSPIFPCFPVCFWLYSKYWQDGIIPQSGLWCYRDITLLCACQNFCLFGTIENRQNWRMKKQYSCTSGKRTGFVVSCCL